MADSKKTTVEILCDFGGWWRYNVMMTCGCFDAAGAGTAFRSCDDGVAPVGSNLASMPDGIDPQRRVVMELPECSRIRLFTYIIPHTLPDVRFIEEAPSFKLTLRILCGRKVLQSTDHRINQWSGASIEVDCQIV